MALSTEIEAWETEMLRTYVQTVDRLREHIASAGLTAKAPRLRRWDEDDPATYGSEIEMRLLRDGQTDDALDVLLCVRGERQRLSPDELKTWLTEQIERLAGAEG